MTPEQFGKVQEYSCAQSDLWAAGVVLFTMVSGHPPFSAPAKEDFYFQRLQYRPEEFWSIMDSKRDSPTSPEFKDLIEKLLRFDPDERPCLSDLMSHKWLSTEKAPEPSVSDDFTEAPTQSFSNEFERAEEDRAFR